VIPYIPFGKKYDRIVRRLRKMVSGDNATARRDALAYVLGLHGLRVTEVIQLKVADLLPIQEQLRVETLKGGKPRRIALGAGVYRQLKRLAAKRGKDEPLFVTTAGGSVHETQWQRGFRELTAELLGGEGLNFHGGRHTFAMRLYHQTKDMQRVKSRLGHRSLTSTQVYVDAYGELDDRELQQIGTIDVLPSLVKDERGERKGRGRTGNSEADAGLLSKKRPRGDRAPSARRDGTVSISTQPENAAVLGKNAEFREMERTETVPSTISFRKGRSAATGPRLLQLHKVRPLKDLRSEVSA